MLDNETLLLVRIFQEAFQWEDSVEHDPVRYIKSYKSAIEEAGQIFAYLGLAKPDRQSPLGWRPTHLLIEVIAKRAVRRSRPIDGFACGEDNLIISLLCDAALGEERPERYPLCAFNVLNALGLTRETTDGDDRPTLQLRRLFAEAYHDHQANKREAEGNE